MGSMPVWSADVVAELATVLPMNVYVASKGSPESGTFPVLAAANWPTVLHEATRLGARRFVRVEEGKWTDNPARLIGVPEWWIVRLPLIE